MFELLKLDDQIDLDVLLNVTYFQEQILDQFDQIAVILNQTMDGFLLEEHIERMNQFKSKFCNFYKPIKQNFRWKMEKCKFRYKNRNFCNTISNGSICTWFGYICRQD